MYLSFSISLLAGNPYAGKTKEAKAREFLKNQPLEFIENKGQFTNTDGNAADNVLFKTSFGNCDIYITDKGLSYVFVKMEAERPKSERPKSEDRSQKIEVRRLKTEDRNPAFGEKEKEENRKVSYYRLDMDLVGANIVKSNIIKEEESIQGHFNYFYPHCPQGIYDVKAYGKITIKNIYKGIDWVIYTNADSKDHPLKYDFVVHPGADYKAIQIKFLNAQSTSLTDNDTKLKIQTIAGNIEEGNLYSYLINEKTEVTTNYVISADSTISFKMADYDSSKILIIDPLVWATYYGGTVTDFNSISIDNKDNIYITGSNHSTDFPTQHLTGAYWQANSAGGIPGHNVDLFILKFDSLNVRQWATYYGGTDIDAALSICTDSLNYIYITGDTYSTDFPTQQLTGAYWQSSFSGGFGDVFILKFNNQGVRQWATYYGGNAQDGATSILTDNQGNLYITGGTTSQDLPTQQLTGAYWQATNVVNYSNVFILKFNYQGVRQWATYYGGEGATGYSMCIDSQNNLFITGVAGSNFPTQQLSGAYWQANSGGVTNAFILKFNNQGLRLWATYYGGNGGIMGDCAQAICADSHDNIFITGFTGSTNFPIQQFPGAYWQDTMKSNTVNIFILKFNNQGVRQWATYYGGSSVDYFNDCYDKIICADKQDNIYITGLSCSQDFPVQLLSGEYFQVNDNGVAKSFILKFCNSGVRQWATLYGTGDGAYGRSIAVNSQNSVFFIGSSWGPGLYTMNPGNGAYFNNIFGGIHDSYIIKMNFLNNPYINNYKPTSLQANKNNICRNDNGNLILNAFGGSGGILKWYIGGCGLNYIGMDTVLTLPFPTQTTTYFARWEIGCNFSSDCDSIIIKVKPSPMINLGGDTILCQDSPFLLNATYPNASYLWQDNSTNPTFNVSQQGLYWVKTTIDSCSSIDSINIIIEDCEIILEIPNFFSPNNDDVNDVFHPSKIKGILSMHTMIYNRWGNLVFTTDELSIKWDGKTNKGDQVADGVYYWIVNYSDRNGITASKNGSVTVLR
jgi:gliding motility-associated-like protein